MGKKANVVPMGYTWHTKCMYRGIREITKMTWRNGKCPEDICIICSGAPKYMKKKNGTIESKPLAICQACGHSEHLSCSAK